MKKIIVLLCAIAACFCLSACSLFNVSSTKKDPDKKPEVTDPTVPGGDDPDEPYVPAPDPASKQFTITFDANGGNFPSGVTVPFTLKTDKSTGRLTELPGADKQPTLKNYEFAGWTITRDGNDAVSLSTVFVKNTVVYAKWRSADVAAPDYKYSYTPNASKHEPKLPAEASRSKEQARSSGTGNVNITFNAGSGAFRSGEKSVNLTTDAGGSINVGTIDTPVLDGHAFFGWCNADGELIDPNNRYSSAATYTALYLSGEGDYVYDYLFDEKTKVSVRIDMPSEQWLKLNADYYEFFYKGGKSPIYRQSDSVTITLTYEDTTLSYYYEEVGIRMKGNTSRHAFYNESGFFDTSHFKLSFKETFDDKDEYKEDERKEWEGGKNGDARTARKNRKLGGMEKVDLKTNSTVDETYAKDIFAMKLFRDNGLIAPQATLCAVSALQLDNNYVNLGIYKLYENVDDIMIARWMNDSKGDLYKCAWGSGVGADFTVGGWTIGVEDELNGEFYTYDKKTNKKAKDANGQLDFSSMSDFIKGVNAKSPDFDKLLDTEYFAKFEAVNYLLGNPDCIRNHSNNFYTYFRSDGRAIFIPYDYDRCLGITNGWDPMGDGMIGVAPYTRQSTLDNRQQTNPIYIKLIDKGAPYGEGTVLDMFRTELIKLSKSSMISVDAFDAFAGGYESKYRDVPAGAIGVGRLSFGDHGTGNIPYDVYISGKLATIENNIDNYRQ